MKGKIKYYIHNEIIHWNKTLKTNRTKKIPFLTKLFLDLKLYIELEKNVGYVLRY